MLKKFFLIFNIFFFQFFIATAETSISIAYIDFEFLVKKSLPGLEIKKKIDDISTQKKNELNLIKKKLVDEENDLIKQKNILNEEKFNAKLLVLKKKISEFKKKELEHNNFIKSEYNKLNQSLLSKIEPILIAYTDENNIKMLLLKKNLIVADKNLDITSIMLELVNNKVKLND